MDIQIDIEGCEVIETALDGVTPIGEYQPDFRRRRPGAGQGDAASWDPAGSFCAVAGRPMGRADVCKSLNVSKKMCGEGGCGR